jgi:uncharacterized lipoprotein NlpE involved in copper resistance
MKKYCLSILMILTLAGCNNMNKNGESTTSEGTTVNDRNNSDMEDNRTGATTDTVRSPGSNSENIEKGDYNARDEQKQIPPDNAGYQKGNDKTK